MPGRRRRSAQSNLPLKNVPIEEPANLNKKELAFGMSPKEEKAKKQESPSMGTNIEPFKGINEGERTIEIGQVVEKKCDEKKDAIGIDGKQIEATEFVPSTQSTSPPMNEPIVTAIRRRGGKPTGHGQQRMEPKIGQKESSKLEEPPFKNKAAPNLTIEDGGKKAAEGGYSLRKRLAATRR